MNSTSHTLSSPSAFSRESGNGPCPWLVSPPPLLGSHVWWDEWLEVWLMDGYSSGHIPCSLVPCTISGDSFSFPCLLISWLAPSVARFPLECHQKQQWRLNRLAKQQDSHSPEQASRLSPVGQPRGLSSSCIVWPCCHSILYRPSLELFSTYCCYYYDPSSKQQRPPRLN